MSVGFWFGKKKYFMGVENSNDPLTVAYLEK